MEMIETARQRMSSEDLLEWDGEDFTPPIVVALEEENKELRTALADANRKSLELTRVNNEQRLQERRLDVALARAGSDLRAALAKQTAAPMGLTDAWEALRAEVLHGVDGLDNDQVNIVLGMIDYHTPTAQPTTDGGA